MFSTTRKFKVYRTYFFMEKKFNGILKMDMIEKFLIPQFDADEL